MFNWIFVKEENPTEIEIKRLYEDRAYYDPTSEEYQKINARLKELLELKEMEHKPKFQVSGDTLVKVGAMLVIGGLIVFREELVGPVTSKALSLMTKMV